MVLIHQWVLELYSAYMYKQSTCLLSVKHDHTSVPLQYNKLHWIIYCFETIAQCTDTMHEIRERRRGGERMETILNLWFLYRCCCWTSASLSLLSLNFLSSTSKTRVELAGIRPWTPCIKINKKGIHTCTCTVMLSYILHTHICTVMLILENLSYNIVYTRSRLDRNVVAAFVPI